MRLLILLTLSMGICHAAPLTGVDLKLVSDTATVQPAKPFTVGLHIHHHKGYHTYWKNPGIVGVPTNIEWTLPDGFTADPIQWPTPEIVDMAGHPAHGFHRDVLLLVRITPPSKLEAKKLTLRAEINWMACAKTCHPGHTSRSLSLPLGKAAPSKSHALFAEAKKDLPTPLTNWSAKVLPDPDASIIRLLLVSQSKPPAKLNNLYFFSSDGQISSDRPQKLTQQGEGKYTLSLERSEYGPKNSTHLPGILTANPPLGTGIQPSAEINLPYPGKNDHPHP